MPEMGIVNGSKVILLELGKDSIICLNCRNWKIICIPRSQYNLKNSRVICKQFPLKLAFEMTINKAQGKTIKRVGYDTNDKVFSHGHLYVAFSRAPSRSAIVLFVHPLDSNNDDVSDDLIMTEKDETTSTSLQLSNKVFQSLIQ